MQNTTHKLLAFLLCLMISMPLDAQLRIGTATTGVNFRKGPGKDFAIHHTIDSSNLLVVLPREPMDEFIEVFDVETSSRGYVHENLIQITDTLNFGKQNFFEKSGETSGGHIEIDLLNSTQHALFVWINQISYDLSPREKRTLILEDEEVIYFASTPGFFPVFGKEFLAKGSSYSWKFSK